MDNAKNSSLDVLAVAAVSGGIPILVAQGEKWYIGLVLVLVGAGLSYLKYKVRST